jgi:hypothetical protein
VTVDFAEVLFLTSRQCLFAAGKREKQQHAGVDCDYRDPRSQYKFVGPKHPFCQRVNESETKQEQQEASSEKREGANWRCEINVRKHVKLSPVVMRTLFPCGRSKELYIAKSEVKKIF